MKNLVSAHKVFAILLLTTIVSTASCATMPDVPLNTWQPSGMTGIEYRQEDIHLKQTDSTEATASIVKMDPQYITFSVGYQPNQAQNIQNWAIQNNAEIAINGGFFNGTGTAVALVISNGQVQNSSSYVGMGGLFYVNNTGQVGIQALAEQPYNPQSQLQQATECQPMLIENGTMTQFTDNTASANPRSIVAIDQSNNVLFIATQAGVSLTYIAQQLIADNASLHIVTALAMDGGSSTALYLTQPNSQDPLIDIEAGAALPLVILAKSK